MRAATIDAMPRGPAPGAPALSEPLSRERHRILHTVQDRLEEVAKTAVAVMRTEIPSYALQDERFFDDVLDQVLTHFRMQLAALAGNRDIAPEDLVFSRAAAMRRARAGFALEDWISAFRVGRQVLWDALLDCAGTSAEAQQAALSLVTPLMRYVDYASTHAAQAYVEYQQHVVADADRERRDLLDQLLAGAAPTRGPLLAAGQAYGLGPHSPMMAVVAVCVGDTRTGDLTSAEHGYATSASISVAGPWAGRTLVVVRHGEVVAVPVVRTGMDVEDICAHFEAVQQRLAREGTMLSMGISTLARGPANCHGPTRRHGPLSTWCHPRAEWRRCRACRPSTTWRCAPTTSPVSSSIPAYVRCWRTTADVATPWPPPYGPSRRRTSTCGWPPTGCGCTTTRRTTGCAGSRNAPGGIRAGSPTSWNCWSPSPSATGPGRAGIAGERNRGADRDAGGTSTA